MGEDLVRAEPISQVPAVVVEQDGGLLSKWGERESKVAHSMNLDTDEGKEQYLQALGTADRRAKESTKQDLEVMHWLLHEVQLTSQETGEVSPALRLVFVLTDGTTISTTSEPLIRHWWSVLRVYGNGPFKPPLTIRFRLVKAQGPGEYLQFEKCSRRPAETNHKPKR